MNKTVSFAERVRNVVRNIPRGQTRSYAQVAKAAGNARAHRAAGTIMKNNNDPSVPCHRVIRSDGTLGGYNRGTACKRKILHEEGAL